MRGELLEYVVGYDDVTLVLHVTDEDWTVIVWHPNGSYILGDSPPVDVTWPHGIRALSLFTQEMTARSHDPVLTRDEVRGLVRRAASDVPYACGIDWIPAEQRVAAMLTYVLVATHGDEYA